MWVATDSIPEEFIDTTGVMVKLVGTTAVTTSQLVGLGVSNVIASDTLVCDGWQLLVFEPATPAMPTLDELEALAIFSEVRFLPRTTILGVPSDTHYWTQFNLHQTRCEAAWDITTGDEDVVIAVIDLGVDFNHPDIAPNLWTNDGEVPGNGLDDDGNGYADDIHGYTFQGAIKNPNVCPEHDHGTLVVGFHNVGTPVFQKDSPPSPGRDGVTLPYLPPFCPVFA